MSWDCNSSKAPLSASYLNALYLSQQRYLQTRLTKYLYVISKLPGAWWNLSSGTASWERDCAPIVTYCYCAFVARARFGRHLVGGKVVSETLIVANKTSFRQCCLHQARENHLVGTAMESKLKLLHNVSKLRPWIDFSETKRSLL